MRRTTKIFLYILFALATFSIFIYVRFPAEMVEDAVSQEVARFGADVAVEAAVIRPAFPPGVKLMPLLVNYADQPFLRMDYLKITPDLRSFFTSSQRYACYAGIGSGELKGRAETSAEGSRVRSKIALTLNRVPLDYIEFLTQWKNYRPHGDLDATISFDSIKGGGTADIHLEISPARIEFEPPLMGIEALDFTLFKSQLVATQRMLQIKNCDAIGDQIEGKISGSIIFRDPIEDSPVTLTLTVKPQPAFIAYHKNDMIGGLLSNANAQKRGVVFRISGTLTNPRYVIR